MSTRTAPSWVVALAIASSATPASAQSAEAQTLFEEGRELLKQKQYEKACEKFAASERLDPQSGTEINFASCLKEQGKTASAWEMYKRAASSAKRDGNDARASKAKDAASELQAELVKLTIDVPAENVVDDLVVKRNGKHLDRAEWGVAVPVDPDEYEITAEAPGREPWTKTITIKAKDKTIEIPKLARSHKQHGKHDEPEPEPTGRKYETATITLAAVGIGGLVLGTGFALYARDVESQSDALCPGTRCADARGLELNSTARLDATIADVAWGLGAAAAIGAGTLWYLGRSSDHDSVSIAPIAGRGHTGIAIGGRF